MDPTSSQLPPMPPVPTRSRTRHIDESEAARIKREKAAERQRRKRKRDREGASSSVIPSTLSMFNTAAGSSQLSEANPVLHNSPRLTSVTSLANFGDEQLTPDELQRRERVRAAARERQRKHRQQVKARKMRDMGMEMAPDMMSSMGDIYRVHPDGQYQQVLHELQQHPMPHDPTQIPIPQHEPPFPHGQPLGGQTFASTLLLSFSCAPLLKQHLLRTLSMTNEELASLEPIIAEAWDHWDHNRRMHYAEQAAKAASGLAGPPFSVDLTQGSPFPPSLGGPSDDPNAPSNEFRARFARSLVAPSPFAPAPQAQPTTNGSEANQNEHIDPHLGSPTMDGTLTASSNDD